MSIQSQLINESKKRGYNPTSLAEETKIHPRSMQKYFIQETSSIKITERLFSFLKCKLTFKSNADTRI